MRGGLGRLRYHRLFRSVKINFRCKQWSPDGGRAGRAQGILAVDHSVCIAGQIGRRQAEQFIPEPSLKPGLKESREFARRFSLIETEPVPDYDAIRTVRIGFGGGGGN